MHIRGTAALAACVMGFTPAAAVQCVNPGGTGGCFASIQAAVDAAANGEQIDVAAGTYAENVQIPGPLSSATSLTLVGAGAGVTVVDGGGGDVITIGNAVASIVGVSLRNGSVGLRTLAGSSVSLEDSEVSGNTGGGIQAGGVRLTLLATTIVGNSTTDRGGGIHVQNGRVFVTETLVSQNAAPNGAGLHATRGIVTVERSTVSDNDASDSGGGIFGDRRARITIIDSTVSGNTCLDAGGGILGRITALGTTIVGNVADRGGGVFAGIGTMKLTNCTVSGNQAAAGGGVLHAGSGPRIALSSTTVANNAATFGGGVYIHVGPGALVLARNTIVANNTATSEPDCGARVRSRGYNLIENTSGCTLLGTAQGDVTGVDPLLGPLAANGGPTDTHALLAGSPAIDAGNPAEPKGIGTRCPLTDQRGVARTGRCDIGAYEAP